MSQVFTITQATPYVFTATVVRNDLTVSQTAQPLTVSQINPSFTATLYQTVLSVTDSTLTNVTITTQPASVFTGTMVSNEFTVDETLFTVTATSVVNTVTISQSNQPISITYNPSIVEYLFQGQPVYTTSSVQFKQLTLGNTSTFTFPADDGTYGLALFTDGNGQLFWGPASGGGVISWNLNSDLITNGFKIRSNSTAVDLTLLGGHGQLRLDTTATVLSQTGTNGIIQLSNTNARATISANQAQLVAGTSTITLNTSTTSTIAIANDFLLDTARDIKITGRTVSITAFGGGPGIPSDRITVDGNVDIIDNGTIEARDVTARLQVVAPRGFFNTLTSLDAAFIDVPPLRFSNGEILYGPGSVSTSSLSMAGNIYTNDYAIKSNESVGGTLRLQQGGTKLNIHNTFTNIQFGTGRKDFGQGATIEINSGSTYGSLIRAEANEVQINATTATLFGDVYFERAINFGTGATAVAFDGDLYDLRDVQLSSPSAGQVLKYNGTKWVNGTDSASTGTGVDSIIAGLGIHVTTSTRDITITNIGVQSLTASNGLVVNKGTGTVNVSIGNLPIQEGDGGAIVVDTSTFGTTKISVDYVELFDHIVPGPGIYKQVNEQNKTITISTTGTGFEVLSDHLYTVGFDIRGENNPLNIRAGQVYIGTETRQSIISMPVNTDMRIYSDYGIVLDTPDDESIQILSPFTVSHRTGQSRISTDAVGNTRLNDQFIYITATNRIVLNTSIVKDDSIKWQLATGIGHVLVEANTATISGQLIKLASTDRTRVGSDVYHSRIGVQDITNFNDTGPPTVSKGIQFQDQTVQRTAYIGGLDFGAITAPATNMEQFLLQLQSVDFGTFTQPSTYAFDAGQIE